MNNDTAPAARITINANTTVHIGTVASGPHCGARQYRNRAAQVFRATTADVTCTRCATKGVAAPAAPVVDHVAPAAAPAPTTCGHRIPASNHGVCLICS